MYFLENVHINNINAIRNNRIDVYEGIDVNKTIEPKECDVCHYYNYGYNILKIFDVLVNFSFTKSERKPDN